MPAPPPPHFPHSRVRTAARKTVMRGGAVIFVMLFIAFLVSGPWRMVWKTPGGTEVALEKGRLYVVQSTVFGLSGPSVVRIPAWFNWGFEWGTRYTGKFVAIPLWLPALLSLLATAAAWRADAKHIHRARAGHCPACGYDRAGLAANAVCPECGKQPEAQ